MKIRAFGLTDVGRRREKNEDSLLLNSNFNLYVVADGMGGHLGGDIASKLAVATVDGTFRSLEDDPEMTLQDGGIRVKAGEYQGYLRYAVRLASRRIYERANADSLLRGMGTTAVIMLFRNNKVYIANVGDSRAYRVRGDRMLRITRDHSLVGEQIRAGILSEDDARGHRLKNIITRSVGFQEDVEADIDIRVVREGDCYCLCTDGLSNMLRDEEMRDIIATNDVEPACRRLVDVANARGGDDNITVVLAKIEGLDEENGATAGEEMTIEDS